MATHTMQRRWALITQISDRELAACHTLEKSLLEKSKNSAEGIDQAIWIHPRIQAGIEKKYRRISPWWDRKLFPAERSERWDNFLADIQKEKNWDHCDIKIQNERKLEDIKIPC